MPRANSANWPSGPFVFQLWKPIQLITEPSMSTIALNTIDRMAATVADCVSCEPIIETLSSITPNNQKPR